MQQVIVIHGGTTFKDYDAYLQSLSQKKLDIGRFIYKPKWKELLQDNLGSEYQVLNILAAYLLTTVFLLVTRLERYF